MNIFSFHVKRNFSNSPLFHFTRTHYSNLQALTEKYPILKKTWKNPVFRKPNL